MRLTDFAERYRRMRRNGYTHREIADELGYKFSSMSKTVSRARKEGHLPAYEGYDPAYRYRADRLKAGA